MKNTIPLVMADDLKAEIAAIPELAGQIHDNAIRIADVVNTLERINLLLTNNELVDKKKIFLENFKLAVLKGVDKYLDDLNYCQHRIEPVVETKPSGWWHWLKVGFLSLFALIGLTESSVMTFLGATVLLTSLFPAIPFAAMITIAALFTAINGIQFIAFEVGILKNMFGVSSNAVAKKMIEAHEQQIDVTGQINHRLADVNVLYRMTKEQFLQFKKIAVKCNQDVDLKRVTYFEYKEHPAKKALRLTFTGFGALMAIVGSYFGATMFLTTMAPAMLGTPLGWIIIGGLVVSSVVFYLAMQGKGMKDMFNPWMKLFDHVKEKVKAFHTVNDEEFNHVLMNQKIFRKDDVSSHHESNKNISAPDLHAIHTSSKSHDSRLFTRRHSFSSLDSVSANVARMK